MKTSNAFTGHYLVPKRLLGLPRWFSGDTQETWVPSLGWENTLEEEMATHSSILAWRIPRTEEPGRPWSLGSQRVGQD